jgi:hypothetical protein
MKDDAASGSGAGAGAGSSGAAAAAAATPAEPSPPTVGAGVVEVAFYLYNLVISFLVKRKLWSQVSDARLCLSRRRARRGDVTAALPRVCAAGWHSVCGPHRSRQRAEQAHAGHLWWSRVVNAVARVREARHPRVHSQVRLRVCLCLWCLWCLWMRE